MSDKVEAVLWESEVKRSNLFKSKFGHRKLLRKNFLGYRQLKNDCSEPLKRAFFNFLQIFWVTKLKPFSGRCEARGSKLFKSKFGHRKLLRKQSWSHLEVKHECSECLKKVFLVFFVNFWVTKLKLFSGKGRESVQNYLNQNLVTESVLENSFEAILISKTNVLSVWKGRFSVSKTSITFCGKVCNVCYLNVGRLIKNQKMKTGLWNLFWENDTRVTFILTETRFIKYSS